MTGRMVFSNKYVWRSFCLNMWLRRSDFRNDQPFIKLTKVHLKENSSNRDLARSLKVGVFLPDLNVLGRVIFTKSAKHETLSGRVSRGSERLHTLNCISSHFLPLEMSINPR